MLLLIGFVCLTFGTFFAFSINRYDKILQKLFYTWDNTTVQKITGVISRLERPILVLYAVSLIAIGYYGSWISTLQTIGLTLGMSFIAIKICESPYNFAVKWLNEKNKPLNKVDNIIWRCHQHSTDGQELIEWLEETQNNPQLISEVKSRFKDQPKFQEILAKWELRGNLQANLAVKTRKKSLKI